MRITQNALFNNLRQQLQTNSSQLVKAQEAVSTQKNFNALSDDPTDAGRVLDLKSALSQSSQYLKNIQQAQSVTDTQDSTMDSVNTALGRVKELLLGEANQATSSTTSREAARIEISQLGSQILQSANTTFNGKYIYGGFAVTTPPFADASLTVTPGVNTGGAVASGQKVADLNQAIYHDYQIQFTAPGQYNILDSTAGTTVASNQTYTSGSAIQFAGMQLTLTDSPTPPATGDSFTINTTPPGTYQGDSQRQMIEIQPGTRVATGTPGNQIFSGTGLTGGVDIFSMLNQINNALSSDDSTAINNLLGTLDTAQKQVVNERTTVGARVNMLTAANDRQTNVQTSLDTMRGSLEDADIATVMTTLNQQQNTYDASLTAASKIVQKSLLDFLS